MSTKVLQVLRDALQLPPRARADVAGTLLRSLDSGEDLNVEGDWAAELERRVASEDSGKVKLLPWDQVRRRLRASLRNARAKG